MSLFIETLKILDGKPVNLFWHNKRLARARRENYGIEEPLDLLDFIRVPDEFQSGIVKCRITYSETITGITFSHHTPRRVTNLKMVVDDHIDYTFKYADRQRLETLLRKQPEKNGDILIIKNGFVTDTSYSNIVFHDGSRWVTPDTPLLAGTQRDKLIHEGIISEASISPDDLKKFKKARLINALLEFDGMDIDIDQIVW
ncbi:MAG: aminotransferase class IV [Bacteroidales bacterium]|nr:aminotransferase class IV [Bacteroidales bacterium]